jgi:hypothetical protein
MGITTPGKPKKPKSLDLLEDLFSRLSKNESVRAIKSP